MGNDNILIVVVLAVIAYLVIAKKGLANLIPDFPDINIFGTPPPRPTIYAQTSPFVTICPSDPTLLYGDRNCRENPYREADPTQVSATGYPLTEEAAVEQDYEYYFDIETGQFKRR